MKKFINPEIRVNAMRCANIVTASGGAADIPYIGGMTEGSADVQARGLNSDGVLFRR